MNVVTLMDVIEIIDEHLAKDRDGLLIAGYSFDEYDNLIVYNSYNEKSECECFSKNGLEYCIVPLFCFNYQECLKLSPIIKICGHSDWRISTISECKMLFDMAVKHGHIVWTHADDDILKPISFNCEAIKCCGHNWEDSYNLYNALLLVRKIS